MKKIIPLLSFAGILVACGYKGPLYLPKPTPAPIAKPAAIAESAMTMESEAIESSIQKIKTSESMPKKSLLPAMLPESTTS